MKILWIAFVWPESTSSAAGVRTVQLISICRESGHEVRVCSPCQDNRYRAALEIEGIATKILPPNDPAFDGYVRDYSPDIVFFDRFIMEEQFGWRVREQCPEALRILDTIDLHSLRRIRQAKVMRGEDPLLLTDTDLSSGDALREIAAIYRSDLSLIISGIEAALLRSRYKIPDELIVQCGLSYALPANVLNFEPRRNFAVIGNFNHPPNADSVRLLNDHLWLRIRKACERISGETPELHIYGAYPSPAILALDDLASGFRVRGWTEDVQETLVQYRVNLAPLRFGAGLKGKIADGWRAGTPCIATSIAAEGMHDGLPFGGGIADDWEEYAALAAELYSNRTSWEQAQQKSLQIIETLFSERSQAPAFSRAIDRLVSEREERRQRNFTGAMLWAQGNRSTEYFSRWIEEKNRKPGAKE